MSRVVVLGGGESGVGSAVLAKKNGFDVFLSDMGNISEKYATMLDEWDIDGDGDLLEVDGYLLGFDPDMNVSIDELFTVEGDGEMVIEATEAGSEAATGTKVYLNDLDGNTVATYVAIVFGDANGDGFADKNGAGFASRLILDAKGNLTCELVDKSGNTEVCIEKLQMGIGCVDSWKTLPKEEYLIPYADYTFKFRLTQSVKL